MSSHWAYIQKQRRKFIREYYTRLKRDLRALSGPLVDFLKQNPNLEALRNNLDTLLDMTRIHDTMIDLYGKVGREFGTQVRRQIAFKSQLEEDAWEDFLRNYAQREAGKKIESIRRYSKKEYERLIQEAMTEGLEGGVGTEQFADNFYNKLKGEWNRSTFWKAMRIAQTEVIGASNRASFEGARQTGYNMRKTWLPAPLGVSKNERHTLPGAVQEYTVNMEQKFMVDGGMGYEPMDCPGDASASASNVINCKCSIYFEVI